MPTDDTPYNPEPIKLLPLHEAARRRPEMYFGATREDPSLLTQVVRGIILDVVSQSSPTERVDVHLTIVNDLAADIRLTYPGHAPAGLDKLDEHAHLPLRYGLASAAFGFTQAADVHVGPAFLHLHLEFDPALSTPGASLSRDLNAYADPTGAGPWLTPDLLNAVTIEDRRR